MRLRIDPAFVPIRRFGLVAAAPTGCDGRRSPAWPNSGFPGHGDAAHCGGRGNAHMDVSWQHAPARPFTPAAWVDTVAS